MKINAEVIARAALRLLDGVGLDGLTMRLVAQELGVRAPTLYWHLKNKQELLDAMATLVYAEASERLEPPRDGDAWQHWIADWARHLRQAMLGHRDGARVLAGTYVNHPAVHRSVELGLRTLTDAGFPLTEAARSIPAVLHYTIGSTIEQQAHGNAAYGDDNPYAPGRLAGLIDAEHFPLTAQVSADLLGLDADAGFEHGLRVVILGLEAARAGHDRA
ncbi:TetR/AcrR family transcriptional regulator C-terminal domain-containing protein [Streptomyces capillispiralis]|uniref:TetR family transcriptional regulator n=1 Tax=Streptomyces capillispiralis TaxID=68182 RepID=A0A561TGG7_9ACTN|nr:TetR/AcrR family transcriptional regulator C-terminal domain-containing protein [Streptomyces capillispiralis]TWF86204.1 TetR family transcriptional regulator [Streptomyces capillispiralis]GHH91126.1 putative transcriptional regulator, TetR family (tetracyclin resistance) [Streptomyces capillispiralis]